MAVRRLLPLSGIVFVALVLIGVVGLGGSTPSNDASAQKVFSFYDAHHARQTITAFILAASVPFLVFFAASLATSLWPADGVRRAVWQLVLIGGSIVFAAVLLVVALIHFALADAADQGLSGNALRALNALDADSWIAFNAGFGVMMLGAAGALLTRVGGFRWLGWAALVLGIALFIPYADFFALLLSLVWMIVASVILFRGRLGPGNGHAPQTT